MEITNSEVVTNCSITCIHPYAPQMGFSPLEGGKKTSPLLRFFPLREVSVRSVAGFFLLRDDNTDMHMGFSLSSYGSRNPPLWDFPHLESPTLRQRFFPLRAHVWCFATRIFLTRNTNTVLRSPLVWTGGKMNTFIHPYSTVGFPLVGSTPMWDVPHTEDSSTVRLALMLEVSNHYSGWGPLSRRRIQSANRLYPHFRPLLYRYRRGCNRMCSGISWGFS